MSLQTATVGGPVPVQDSNLDKTVNTQPKHKDFLGRTLAIGDRVVMIKSHYKEFQLAQITGFTAKKVRVAWGSGKWDTHTTDGYRFVKVEGPDLTWYLLAKGIK